MRKYKSKNKQAGVALAIGIVLLLIISLIGVNSMKSALLQERMAAGLKNREIADAAAMSLLVDIERWLYSYYQTNNGVTLGVGSNYMMVPRGNESYAFKTQRNLSGGWVGPININSKFNGILAQEPRFIIEPLAGALISGTTNFGATNGEGIDGDNPMALYRITAKATDTTGNIISGFESVMSVKIR